MFFLNLLIVLDTLLLYFFHSVGVSIRLWFFYLFDLLLNLAFILNKSIHYWCKIFVLLVLLEKIVFKLAEPTTVHLLNFIPKILSLFVISLSDVHIFLQGAEQEILFFEYVIHLFYLYFFRLVHPSSILHLSMLTYMCLYRLRISLFIFAYFYSFYWFRRSVRSLFSISP